MSDRTNIVIQEPERRDDDGRTEAEKVREFEENVKRAERIARQVAKYKRLQKLRYAR